MPVSANLLHHAVEMFLKGCLVQRVGFKGLPRGRNGHDLNALWLKFQRHYDYPSLDRFTPVIADLHNFEKIRYPENLITGGGSLGIGFPSGARHVQLQGPKVPEYQIAVEDIDSLVKTLFELGSVNPNFFQSLLNQEHARKYFKFRNKNPLTHES